MPEKFKKLVKAIAKQPGVDNPYAVATAAWKKSHGGIPSKHTAEDYSQGILYPGESRLKTAVQEGQWFLHEWVNAALEDFFRNPNLARTDLRQLANMLSTDYLRKMGTGERQQAAEWLKKNKPQVLDLIKKEYPHQLETGEVQTKADLSTSFFK